MLHVWIAGDWDQSYLSVSPFSDQVLFGRGRKEFNWHLYWKPELAISLLKSFFFTILSQPTFAEEDRYHEGTLSSHLGSDLFGHNFRPFSRPDFEEGDGTNHTASVTILLVVTNSFQIPSHRAPQIHENTSKCCPNHSCLVSIICIKHFCIFIVSDHKTMAVGDNILQRGTDAGDREKASVFLRSTNSTPRNIVTSMALCRTTAKPYLHMKGPD